MTPQLVLASASPRRSELLRQIGIRHLIHAVDIDETPWPGESPLAYVERVASEKSAACRALRGDALPVLAADTSVVCDGEIMGKPENGRHAARMLTRLSGREHQVYSAVSLRGDGHWQAVSVSRVKFRCLSEAEIGAYWDSGEPRDKAGGYAIQGLASIFIESITGSFSGVMGLPLFETAQLLAKQGIRVIA
ncbi:Maf family nucleotide pyrophosphatase [Methylomonas sp. SURF-2]|uniref:dTTP/UTP pyrophosphatase n=1 Tax=Methylomonas subterranea TaxID=2952225 RepID=A0ABT1TB73_9GAMM|nr:nucleoside triphosphate pyrophosphatase [Methylomonas sp. SURF-2]MCQ8102712.1 Maf family nucleotide pyrophosphatase [Methylomonas sp. SURF-2]